MPCCTSALLITLTWALLVAPLADETQPSAPHMPRIGLLSSRSSLVARPHVEAFRQEVRALGYIDGQPLKPQRRFYQLQELRKFHRGAAECRLNGSVCGSGLSCLQLVAVPRTSYDAQRIEVTAAGHLNPAWVRR